jgi:hypothetical protein
MPCTARQPDEISPAERLMTEKQAAAWLGYGWTSWLRERDRIAYIRLGKFRRYKPRFLERYQATCIVKPTPPVKETVVAKAKHKPRRRDERQAAPTS